MSKLFTRPTNFSCAFDASSASDESAAVSVKGGVAVGKSIHVGGSASIMGEMDLNNQRLRAVGSPSDPNDGVNLLTLRSNVDNSSIETDNSGRFRIASSALGEGLVGGSGARLSVPMDHVTLIQQTGSIKVNPDLIIRSVTTSSLSTFQSGLSSGNSRITNLASPVQSTDAVNKGYADGLRTNLSVKESAVVATTQPGNLATDFCAGKTVDGCILQTGWTILIKDQINGIENGMYVVPAAAGLPTRTDSMALGTHAAGAFCFVQTGTVNSSAGFTVNNSPQTGDTVGTHALHLTQFSGAGEIIAGAALTKSGNQLDVAVNSTSLEIVGDQINLKSSLPSVTSLGTLSSLAVSSNVSAATAPTLGQHLANKLYVDGLSYITAGTGLTLQGNVLLVNQTQPTITSLGPLNSLTVSGNASSAIAPTVASHFTNKAYVDGLTYLIAGSGISKAGSMLSLNAVQTFNDLTVTNHVSNVVGPSASDHLANKGYVDALGYLGVGTGLSLAAGQLSLSTTQTFTSVVVSAAPTAVGQLTNKAYVDALSYLVAGSGLLLASGTLSIKAAQPTITSVGTLTLLNVTGAISNANGALTVNDVTATAPLSAIKTNGNVAMSLATDGTLLVSANALGVNPNVSTLVNYLTLSTYNTDQTSLKNRTTTLENAQTTPGTGLVKTGSVISVSPTQTQIVTVGTLSALTVSGAIAGSSVALSSTLNVTGTSTLSALTVPGATSLASLTVSGATSLASLTVSGTSSLNSATAASLTVTGPSTFGTSTVGALTGTSASFSGTLTASTLSVTGPSTLSSLNVTGACTASTLSITGTSALNAMTGTTASYSGTMSVSGATTLSDLNGTNASFSGTLGVTGTSTLGPLTVGALTGTNAGFSGNLNSGSISTTGDLSVSNATGSRLKLNATSNSIWIGAVPGDPSGDFYIYDVTGNGRILGWTRSSKTISIGTTIFTDSTDSTSTITGSLSTLGGMGIAKGLTVGGIINTKGVSAVTLSTSDLRTIDTFGGNETAQLYPPTGGLVLNGLTTTLSNLPYANGTYTVASSSTLSTFYSWNGFQASTSASPWSSNGGYNSSGVYVGSASTTDLAGTIWTGEYIEVSIPQPKYVSTVTIWPRTGNSNNAPTRFVIMGCSNVNNSPYTVIYNQSSAIGWSDGVSQTFTVTSPGIYNWIRIIGIAKGTTDVNLQFAFSFRGSTPYVTLTNTTTVLPSVNAGGSLMGALNVGGDVVLSSVNPRVFFPTSGFSAPTFVSRAVGSKIVLWPMVGTSSADYAIGIDAGAMWHSVPSSTTGYTWKWYGGTTPVMTLDGVGNLTLASSTDASTTGLGAAVQVKGGMSIAKTLWTGSVGGTDAALVMQASSGTALLRLTSYGTVNYIQSGSSTSSGSLAPLYFGAYSTPTNPLMIIGTTGTVSIGSTLSGTVFPTAGQYLNIVPTTYTDNTTAASGTTIAFNASCLGQTTLAASNSNVTTTTASTLFIAGPPIAGTNETFGSAYSLNVGSGTCNFVSTNMSNIAITDTIGGNEVPLVYPPTGAQILTGINTSLTNLPYGNGTYYINSSSTAAGFPPWYGFQDKSVPSPWSSALFYTAGGVYTGSRTTADFITNTTYAGELIEVQLPSPKYITQVTIYPRVGFPALAPSTFVIMTSNTTNAAYRLAYSQLTPITWTEATPQTFTLTTPGVYSWIRIVGMSVTSGQYVQFSFSLRASSPYVSVKNTTTALPTVNSGLVGALNVSGDVVLAQTTPRVYFPSSGLGSPTTVTRSAGCKIIVNPAISSTLTDFAIGTDAATLWYGTSSISDSHKWYAGTSNVMTLTGSGNLTVSGQIASPSITSASSNFLFNEDAMLTSTNGIALAGSATYISNTLAPNYSYVSMASGIGTGQASYQLNPGTGFTIDFEMFYLGTSDGISCSFYQQSVPSDCHLNNGGYVVSFSTLMNSIVIVPPGVSSARVGSTATLSPGATASTVTFTSQFSSGTWVPVSVTYKNGFLAVYVNGSLVNSVKTVTPAVANIPGTFIGFSSSSTSGSSYSIRNMRLMKDIGFGSSQGSGNLVYNNGSVSVPTLFASTGVNAPNITMYRNRIINGDMRVDQRSTASTAVTSTGGDTPSVDRWLFVGPSTTTSCQQVQISGVPGFPYALRITNGSALTTSQQAAIHQRVEGVHIADLQWGTVNAQPVTISFWVQSSIGGLYAISLVNTTGTYSYLSTYTVSTAGVWQKVTLTVPGCTTGSWSSTNTTGLYFEVLLNGTAAAGNPSLNTWTNANYFYQPPGGVNWATTSNSQFYLTAVQMEKGTVASAFEQLMFNAAVELCQRYYYRWTAIDAYSVFAIAMGQAGVGVALCSFPVTMRGPVASIGYSSLANFTSFGTINVSPSSIILVNDGRSLNSTRVDFGIAGQTAGTALFIRANNSLGAWIDFSAEL